MNKIGVLINYTKDTNFREKVLDAKSLGIECCQLCFWDTSLYTDENAKIIREVAESESFEVAALWGGWSGPCVWNFEEGPTTIGLVPPEYREGRLIELFRASEFAEKIGVDKVITHVGFLPSDPTDEGYIGTVEAIRRLSAVVSARGQKFLFETGQEPPEVLKRAIDDIGTEAVGVNLDTANLILYGMSSTLDAVEIIGKHVLCTHIKDGVYPTGDGRLGKEVRAGDGEANIPEVLRRLAAIGYRGPLVIEREISGAEQRRDIERTVGLLREILKNIYNQNSCEV